MALKDLFYDKPLTPTSGRAEKTWFTQAKQATGQAALAATAVSNVGKLAISKAGSLLGAGSKAVAKSATSQIAASPIKSTLIAGTVGVAGVSAIKANPKIVTEGIPKGVSGISQVGTNIGKFTKDPSADSAKKIFSDNPIIVGGLLAGGAIAAGKGISSLAASAANTAAIREQTDTLKNQIPNSPVGEYISGMPVSPQQAANLPSEVTTKSYGNSNGVTKSKAKRKPLYKSPITVRNNINIFNKN